MFFYMDGGSSSFIGVRLPSTAEPEIKWRWTPENVAESLSADNNAWTLKMDNTGKITAISPTKIEFSSTFSELSGGVSSTKVGFKDFKSTAANCYRIFNPNRIDIEGKSVSRPCYVDLSVK